VIEGVTASPSRSFRVPVYSPLSPPLLLYFFGPKPKKSGQLDLNRVDARSLALQFAHQSLRTGSLFARFGPTHRRAFGIRAGEIYLRARIELKLLLNNRTLKAVGSCRFALGRPQPGRARNRQGATSKLAHVRQPRSTVVNPA
jgi:hypothetical protein